MPRFWKDAVTQYTARYPSRPCGILPWHINRVYYQLRDAFMIRDLKKILRLSAEIGHYIADANVPLHTTENYNGQRAGQDWHSRQLLGIRLPSCSPIITISSSVKLNISRTYATGVLASGCYSTFR